MAHPGGRPTKMKDEVVRKLEEAFAIGCTDAEACLYVNISRQTLYDYQAKYPEFVDRKETLKQKPFLLARKTVVEDCKTPEGARWFLERKLKKEFSPRQELTGEDGKAIQHEYVPPAKLTKEERLKFLTDFLGN